MYYARYDREQGIQQSLHEHFMLAEMMAGTVSPAVRFRAMKYQDLVEFVRWMGLLHDFGKYTPFFQDFLLNGTESHLKATLTFLPVFCIACL